MLINRVQPEYIGTNRIDPDYYRPEYLADEKLLRDFGSDELRSVGHFFAGPFGSKLPSDLYQSSGIPLFRVGNVGAMEVNMDGMAYLSADVHEELIDSEVVSGDLLIVKASVGEKICRVPDYIPRANITQHIIGIRPNGDVDMDYVAAFLFSKYGSRQLVRRSLGSIIQYLGVTDCKDVLFPAIDSKAQIYLGSIIRKAYKLREYASIVRNLSSSFFQIYQPDSDKAAPTRAFIAKSEAVTNARLDPSFFQPHHTALERKLKNTGAVPIGNIAICPNENWESDDPVITYYEIRDVDTQTGMIYPKEVEVNEAPASAQKIVRNWDILVATVRPNRKNVGFTYPDESTLKQVATSAFAVLRFQSPEEACFWHAWLRTDAGTQQLVRWNAGSTYPTIDRGVAALVLAPNFDSDVIEENGCKWLIGFHSIFYAQKLVQAAKSLVEGMIDGKVTEAELVAAQDALDRGDNSANRALLSRLTRKGFGVPGELPLFPDLDALYDLLSQTEEAPT